MQKDIFKIWVDSEGDINQGKYIYKYTSLNKYNPPIQRIYSNKVNAFARNPRKIQELLYLDKPDVIVTYKKNENSIEKPILCIEFSEQTPMGQNTYQRFPRAVASAEAGVPFIIVFPEKDWVERKIKETSNWEYASPFIFNGLKKLTEFYKIPIISQNWTCEKKKVSPKGYKCYDLVYPNLPDSKNKEMKRFFEIIDIIVKNTLENASTEDLFRNKIIIESINDLDAKRFSKGRDFLKKVPSVSSGYFMPTSKLQKHILEQTTLTEFDETCLPSYFIARESSFIFHSNTNNFRADPYTGTMLVYDYSFCRFGKLKTDRHTNLIIYFPNIKFEKVKEKVEKYYKNRCPFRKSFSFNPEYLTLHLRDGCKFTKQKEIRIFFYFADMIILKDKILF